ncbi:MAG: hypothetical protein LQ338_007268 [Usnochroma carphineum]|nr:MAG: hypothetical protein LQ338_007268 [Usnochroma carphineum]
MAQSAIPYRQIRAKYDNETITVYQAYSAAIAIPAVKDQKLNASPAFKPDRMTWIKPSWAWMIVTGHGKVMTAEEKAKSVRVQWDPERSVRMELLPYQSIRIGISGAVGRKWMEGWIEGIKDVTEMARKLKSVIDGGELEGVSEEELVGKGLVPEEKPYGVDKELRRVSEWT